MTTGKRLFQYALLYKKILIWALVMLTIAVTAELTGPMIAKKMIDDHILGIEKRGMKRQRTRNIPFPIKERNISGKTGQILQLKSCRKFTSFKSV